MRSWTFVLAVACICVFCVNAQEDNGVDTFKNLIPSEAAAVKSFRGLGDYRGNNGVDPAFACVPGKYRHGPSQCMLEHCCEASLDGKTVRSLHFHFYNRREPLGDAVRNIGDLKHLEELRLSNVRFPDTGFPDYLLAAGANLRFLQLQYTSASGPFPGTLKPLAPTLVRLSLEDNSLTGSLPEWIGDFAELTELRLKGNEMGGMLPKSMTKLTKCKSYSVSPQGSGYSYENPEHVGFCLDGEDHANHLPYYFHCISCYDLKFCPGTKPADFHDSKHECWTFCLKKQGFDKTLPFLRHCHAGCVAGRTRKECYSGDHREQKHYSWDTDRGVFVGGCAYSMGLEKGQEGAGSCDSFCQDHVHNEKYFQQSYPKYTDQQRDAAAKRCTKFCEEAVTHPSLFDTRGVCEINMCRAGEDLITRQACTFGCNYGIGLNRRALKAAEAATSASAETR